MYLQYRSNGTLTTEIWVDYRTNSVRIKDYTDDVWETAFGANKNPTIKDFEDLLEDRCFPRSGDAMKLRLRELGLGYYEPLEIVKKTKGAVKGDYFTLEVVEE